jgi:phage-related protein
LRIDDIATKIEWRIVYYIGRHAIAILDIVPKKTRKTPDSVLAQCRRRLAGFKQVDRS